jgi:PAS domain S-box-containing protein
VSSEPPTLQPDLESGTRGAAADELFREMADSAPAPVWATTAAGPIEFVNLAFVEFSGLERAALMGDAWIGLVHPEDLPAVAAAREAGRANPAAYRFEARFRQADGAWRIMEATSRPRFDPRGVFQGYVGLAVDVTDVRSSQRRQQLLIDELNHRVKNTLASVQSLAVATGRNAGSLEQYQSTFLGRISALARAHDLLSRTSWEGAELGDVVRQTLSPYAGAEGRVTISGPRVMLNPNAAVTVHMGLHEMATNAAKYGALATPTGQLDIRWAPVSGSPNLLEFNWVESGVPGTRPPTREGFGSRLIKAVARELDARVEPQVGPDGMSFRWTAPTSHKLTF